jgi:hypothetical protein
MRDYLVSRGYDIVEKIHEVKHIENTKLIEIKGAPSRNLGINESFELEYVITAVGLTDISVNGKSMQKGKIKVTLSGTFSSDSGGENISGFKFIAQLLADRFVFSDYREQQMAKGNKDIEDLHQLLVSYFGVDDWKR